MELAGQSMAKGCWQWVQFLTQHLERIKEWNLHMCPVWLHKFFWPLQRRFPSFNSSISHDALPPGQGKFAGTILKDQGTFAFSKMTCQRSSFSDRQTHVKLRSTNPLKVVSLVFAMGLRDRSLQRKHVHNTVS